MNNRIEDEINQKVDVDREPALVNVINHARSINKTLAQSKQPTIYERHDIITSLNREWRESFPDPNITVTGSAGIIDDQGSVYPINLKGVKATMDGFDVVDTMSPRSPNTHTSGIPPYKVVVRMVAGRLTENDVPPSLAVPRRGALLQADLSDVLIEFHEPSSDRASAWLGVHHAETKQELRNRIRQINYTSDNILEPLSGMELPDDFVHTSDGFARRCLSRFINDKVRFDKRVPYRLSTKGLIGIQDRERDEMSYHEDALKGLMVVPDRLDVLGTGSDRRLPGGIAITAYVLYPDKNKAETPVIVPVNNVTSLRSMRHEHFRARP